HEYVYDFYIRLVHAAIKVIEEGLFAQCCTLAQTKELEHFILFNRQVHPSARYLYRLGSQIDCKTARLDYRLGVTFAAAHDGMDARDQFVLVEWLGHVVVGAKAQASHFVLDTAEASEDQDRALDLGDAQAA